MLNRRITKDIWKAFGILHASFTCVSFHYACMNTKQCFIFKFKEEEKTYSKSGCFFEFEENLDQRKQTTFTSEQVVQVVIINLVS